MNSAAGLTDQDSEVTPDPSVGRGTPTKVVPPKVIRLLLTRNWFPAGGLGILLDIRNE